jgi:DNA polymerase I
LLEHSEISKLVSNYGHGLLSSIEDDGRIRSRYQQILTTGRISSAKWRDDQRCPSCKAARGLGTTECTHCHDSAGNRIKLGIERGTNLQNAHEKFKAAVKPAEGNAFVIYDLAAIELRVLAEYVMRQNQQTQDAITTALLTDKDPHSLTVERVFGIPYAEVEAKKGSDPDMARKRHACKTTNFSAVFDIGPPSLAMRIHAETKDPRPLSDVQVKEAKNFIAGMWQANPHADILLNGFANSAISDGYAETLGGRKRFFTRPQGHAEIAAVRREARNLPIQGTAADIMKLAQVLIQRRFWKADIGWFIANAVHDEVITEGPKEHAPKAKDIVEQAMKEAYGHYLTHVPFKASGGIEYVWKH